MALAASLRSSGFKSKFAPATITMIFWPIKNFYMFILKIKQNQATTSCNVKITLRKSLYIKCVVSINSSISKPFRLNFVFLMDLPLHLCRYHIILIILRKNLKQKISLINILIYLQRILADELYITYLKIFSYGKWLVQYMW